MASRVPGCGADAIERGLPQAGLLPPRGSARQRGRGRLPAAAASTPAAPPNAAASRGTRCSPSPSTARQRDPRGPLGGRVGAQPLPRHAAASRSMPSSRSAIAAETASTPTRSSPVRSAMVRATRSAPMDAPRGHGRGRRQLAQQAARGGVQLAGVHQPASRAVGRWARPLRADGHGPRPRRCARRRRSTARQRDRSMSTSAGHAGHDHPQVDAIEQWPTHPALVARSLVRATPTPDTLLAVPAAAARVHGRDELQPSRIADVAMRPCDLDACRPPAADGARRARSGRTRRARPGTAHRDGRGSPGRAGAAARRPPSRRTTWCDAALGTAAPDARRDPAAGRRRSG